MIMGTRSKDKIKAMIAKDLSDIHTRYCEVKKSIEDNLQDVLHYFHELHAQIPESTSGPLITKTPKIPRTRGVQHIETIPEDTAVDHTMSDCVILHSQEIKQEPVEEVKVGRTRRKASEKAFSNIQKQQSLTLLEKLRRSDSEETNTNTTRPKRDSRVKRKQSARSSSDEETSRAPPKQSKMDETVTITKSKKKSSKQSARSSSDEENSKALLKHSQMDETVTITKSKKKSSKQSARSSSDEENSRAPPKQSKMDETVTIMKSKKNSAHQGIQNNCTTSEQTIRPEDTVNATMTLRRSNRTKSSEPKQGDNSEKLSTVNDTIIAPSTEDIEEPSLYEDAIGKPTPIMSSTMNFNSTMVIQKMMDATVVLEPLSAMKVNETITIKKRSSPSNHHQALRDRKMQQLKEAMANKEFDDLVTDDESSPEIRKSRQYGKKQEDRKRARRISDSTSSSSSDDNIPCTPAKIITKGVNTGNGTVHDVKNTFKPNALFSPYAKESVKKRVEAFEQAGLNSPKPNVDIEAPARLTRTKTRAIAAARAEAAENGRIEKTTVAQKLARKSLAKAKKISLAKQAKQTEDNKENKPQTAPRVQKQQKTTPLGKTKTQLPMSVNRIVHTPANGQYNVNHSKALSATSKNIITSVDSFLQGSKTTSKPNSTEKPEEKKRKPNDEDVKRKREEALKLVTEEKRRKRQEKELKIKLAREAKEKQDMEKRQKAEKEREEKARLAQQMQEKVREEMEKKRMAQIQRNHEKEEKRKQEEQLRLQRLADQEEMERVLAEQRRREQEAERRKEAEARAQQQAAIEAMRIKNQMLALQMKAKHTNNKNQAPMNYILDSEPDDDESDDETKPKYAIPDWAQPHVRKTQLSIQRYIPDRAVFRFFDTRKCTPDLTQLFQGIDRSRLKRTSSAIWKTPPRYSMMEAE